MLYWEKGERVRTEHVVTKPSAFRSHSEMVEDIIWKIETAFSKVKADSIKDLKIEIDIDGQYTEFEVSCVIDVYKKNGWRTVETVKNIDDNVVFFTFYF